MLFILFFSIFISGWSAFYVKQDNNKNLLPLVLSFTGSFIIGITALHLMPEVFHEGSPFIGLFVLLGFFGQLALEQISSGVEHGHIHAPHHHNSIFVWKIMFGLCFHSFIEGSSLVALENGHQHKHLFWGILLHEAPAAFALTSLLILSHLPKNTVLICLFSFASMSSLGALLTQIFSISEATHLKLMAVVVGTFLHISTTILFEADSTRHHHISTKKIMVIVAGLGMALLTLLGV